MAVCWPALYGGSGRFGRWLPRRFSLLSDGNLTVFLRLPDAYSFENGSRVDMVLRASSMCVACPLKGVGELISTKR